MLQVDKTILNYFSSAAKRSDIETLVRTWLGEEDITTFNFNDFIQRTPSLKDHVQAIRLYVENAGSSSLASISNVNNSSTAAAEVHLNVRQQY